MKYDVHENFWPEIEEEEIGWQMTG